MLDTQNQNHHHQHHPLARAILTLLQVLITLSVELRTSPNVPTYSVRKWVILCNSWKILVWDQMFVETWSQIMPFVLVDFLSQPTQQTKVLSE